MHEGGEFFARRETVLESNERFLESSERPGAQKSSRTKAEDDIREAVFRYQMVKTKASVYFLSVGVGKDKDPSAVFMKRFSGCGCKPPVKPYSQSKLDTSRGVRDRKTDVRGVVLRSETIKWLNKTTVELTGGYFWNVRAGSGWTFKVELRNGRWRVTKGTGKWIS